MEFLLFVGGIVLLILFFNLRGRVQRLEQVVKAGASQPATEIRPRPDLELVNQPAVPAAPAIPSWDSRFIAWLKEDWILKLGALLLLIGFGWLASYAFLHNWIGPMGRIALGIIAGVLFLILGWWRIKDFLHQGGVFLVVGSTTILLTIFAAREIYNFFTPFTALTVMFLSTAFVAAASVKYNNRPLALVSLALAGLAPLFTNSPTPNYPGLFLYLFVVILGAVWIVVLTGRRELTAAALILAVFYSLPHWFSFTSADTETLLLFAYAFAAVFFLTNTAGILKLKDKEIIPDLVTAAGNGLFLLVWIMVAVQPEWESLIISAWMIVFAAGAFMTFRLTGRREPFYVYAGVGIAMLAAATAAELHGAALTIAYTIESGIVALLIFTILKDLKAAAGSAGLLIGPMILSVQSMTSGSWGASVINRDFFVLLILCLTLSGLGWFFSRQADAGQDKETKQITSALLVLGPFTPIFCSGNPCTPRY